MAVSDLWHPRRLVLLAGDSTMCYYSRRFAPMAGWGQLLAEQAAPGTLVVNLAQGGYSSKSFHHGALWGDLLGRLSEGDYVLLQFGHNDAHTGEQNAYRHTEPGGDFITELTAMIAEARQYGGRPVLLTQTPDIFFERGKYCGSQVQAEYAAGTRQAAAENGVPLLDVYAAAEEHFRNLGMAELQRGYYMNLEPGEEKNYPDGKEDETHLNYRGAKFFAELTLKLAAEAAPELAAHFRF